MRRARPIVSVVAAVALLGAPLGLAAASPAAGTAAESDAPVVLTGRWAPVAVADRLQPWLARALATSDGSRLRVMVSGETTDAAVAAVRTAGLEAQQTWDKAGVVAAAGTPDQVRAVVPLPGVTYVEGDQELEYTLDTAHEATRSEQALATYKASDGSRVDGSGVTIAVIDSGVDGTHPMFADAGGVSKVVQNRKNACGIEVAPETNEACFVQPAVNDTDTESVGGHGTHVAGIAAGYEVETEDPAGTRLRGAAPGAKLVGLSVGAAIGLLDANAAMNWVLEHQRRPCSPAAEQEGELDPDCPPIRATNHSYGPVSGDNESNSFDENSATVRIQRLLVEMGVTPVWAAGNDGGDGSLAKTNPPGMDLTPGVLMVASYNDGGTGNRDNALSGFSSRGQKGQPQTYPDVSAPGDLITSACRPTLAVCTGEPSYDGGNYQTISGTSMATPYVAGVVAQLAQVDPSISPGGTEELIEDTAHKFGTEYEADPQNTDDTTSFDKGHGLVDVLALLAAQQGLAEPAEPEAGPAACTADSPQVVDPADDATQVIAADAGLQSEPNLDVLEGRMSWDAGAQELTFSIEVTDLAAGTSDEYFRFYVSRGTDPEVYAIATRTASGESFSLRQFDSGASTALTGSFDEETNTVTVVLPAEQYGEVVPDATIAPGDVFAVGQLLGQRATGVVTATADTAQGTCPFTVSSGGTGGGDPDPVVDPGAGGDPGDESAGGDSGSGGAGDSAGGTRGGSGERQDRAVAEQRGAAVSAPTRGRSVVASRSGALPRTGPLMPLTAGLLLLLVGTGVLLAARRGRPAGTD